MSMRSGLSLSCEDGGRPFLFRSAPRAPIRPKPACCFRWHCPRGAIGTSGKPDRRRRRADASPHNGVGTIARGGRPFLGGLTARPPACRPGRQRGVTELAAGKGGLARDRSGADRR